MENQVQDNKSVNYAFKIVGYLGHDNKLFDRTCPACKGMYSSHELANCPKCGMLLTYLTSPDGKALAISEGTVYPAFGPKQDKRDIAAVTNRKNGMFPTYRFKLFSFMDDHGVLIPPAEHGRCRKGAKVEILTMNHQLVPSWFLGRDGAHKVELLIMVYTNYGDSIKVLTEQEYTNKVVYHPLNPDGTPAPLQTEGDARAKAQAEIAILQAKMDELRGLTVSVPTPGMPVANTPQWADRSCNGEVVGDALDPFAKAK